MPGGIVMHVDAMGAEPELPPPGYEGGPEDLERGLAEIRQSAAVNTAVERQQATTRGFLATGLGLFLAAALTDFLDGFFARRLRVARPRRSASVKLKPWTTCDWPGEPPGRDPSIA